MRRLPGPVAAALALAVLGITQSPVIARSTHPVDPALHATSTGTRYYLDTAASRPSSADRAAVAARPTVSYPLANTFALHSKPGSKHTIFLDFNGNTVMVGSWATTMSGYGMNAGNYPGFNLQGDASFTDYEKQFIQQIYNQVAQLYAPFDVDVTTQDPGQDALDRTSAGDDIYGIQIAFTSGNQAVSQVCDGCSGAAPLGTFDQVVSSAGENQPAWVFMKNAYPSTTYLDSAILAADSAAHEAGHTFGLHHDGVVGQGTENYYGGHGNWFPIMGMTPGTRSVGQWSKGEYANANQPEDDLAIIAANGAPYRSDDYPDAGSTPYDLGTKTSYTVKGVIGTDADTDYFTFDRGCAGPMQIKATGNGYGTPLDLRLTVQDGAGTTTLTTNDPASNQTQALPDPWYQATGMDAAATFARAADAPYRVKVEGVGHGTASNGYTGYGSIGTYTLSITSCTTPIAMAKRPTAPIIGLASSGAKGKPVTATVRWKAPKSNGGAAITRYKLQAVKLSTRNKVLITYTYAKIAPGLRSFVTHLPAGRYKFRLVAVNRVGTSPFSAYSKVVLSR